MKTFILCITMLIILCGSIPIANARHAPLPPIERAKVSASYRKHRAQIAWHNIHSHGQVTVYKVSNVRPFYRDCWVYIKMKLQGNYCKIVKQIPLTKPQDIYVTDRSFRRGDMYILSEVSFENYGKLVGPISVR